MKIGLLGGTGQDRDEDSSQELLRNWYISKSKGKSQVTAYPTPGLTEFANIGAYEIRGSIEFGGSYFCVSGNGFYEVSSAGVPQLKGTLNTASGRVSLTHNGVNNGKQILMVDGLNGYIWDSGFNSFGICGEKATGAATANILNSLKDVGGNFQALGVVAGMVVHNTTDVTTAIVGSVVSNTEITIVNSVGAATDLFPLGTESYVIGDAFPDNATHVDFFDSRFIINDPATTGKFVVSASYQGYSLDSLEFAIAERSPDPLSAFVVSNRQLFLVGTKTAEIWYNSGAADFPYEPVQSGFSQWGTIAPYSLIEIAGLTLWLSQNDEGQGLVVASQGGSPQVISSLEIAVEISKLSTITDAYAWSYQYQQHSFYVLNFPTAGKTFVYDISMQEWHEWSSKTLGYHRGSTHTFVYGKHLVGDPETGNIYELDWSNYSDNGDAITRVRRSKSIHGDDKQIIHDGVWLDIKEGVGSVANPDPQIQLRWRDSNGSWSNYHPRSMGSQGERGIRVIWRNLGRSFDRVYEISTSEPVNAVLIDSYAKVRGTREFG